MNPIVVGVFAFVGGLAIGLMLGITWARRQRKRPGADVAAWGNLFGLQGWTWEFGYGEANAPLMGYVNVARRTVSLNREPVTQDEAMHEGAEAAVAACGEGSVGARRTRRDEFVHLLSKLIL